uniref:Phosphatidylinositol glycan anchor biosynthesis class U protein n=1 Tax=Amphimedon queenslandica TaxID=400682 RepID=A0A1X7VM89_AMPQE
MYHVLAVSVLLRLFLLSQEASGWLSDRIELSTPLNSWTRLKEGVALKEAGLSSYQSDLFHETPLVLFLFQYLLPLGDIINGLFFIVADILIAYCLAQLTRLHHQNELKNQEQRTKSGGIGKGVEPILITRNESLPSIVASVYLINPFSILSCSAHSTVCFNNLSIVFGLWTSLKGNWFLCGMGMSLAVQFSLYPVMLLLPLSLTAYYSGRTSGVLKFLLYTVLWMIGILCVSLLITGGSWDFINGVYGVILLVPDFTPNVGLFWYFFMEMFDHFQVFFLCVFQINAFIHAIPLTIRFNQDPMFLVYTLLSLISLFKSYPTVADFIIPVSLLPLWTHVFRYMRFTPVIIGCVLVSSIAGPITWYLWIHTGMLMLTSSLL